MTVTSTQLRIGAAGGAALIFAWFAATRTTLILAYKGGTLAQVHAICDSGIGQFGRLLNHAAAAECNSIDSTITWWNLAGIAGALLATVCGGLLYWRAQHKPQVTQAQ